METGKFVVDVDKETVTFGHTTKTVDGEIGLTTTFEFKNVDKARRLYLAGKSCLIGWRASTGIKEMTTKEAREKLSDAVVDVSKTVERVAATGLRKEVKDTINAALKSGLKVEELRNLITALQAQR